jgi:ribosomal protein S18 acetylase RimI-like enzyme
MTGTTQLPIHLRDRDRQAITEHFLALDPEDRHLRFGASLSDDAVRMLDDRIDFDRDEIFGIAGDDLRLVAVVHVAFYPDKAELGLSVLPQGRGLGLGNALFSRAVMHLARKNGMRVVHDGPETDAYLELPRATPASIVSEWVWDHNARVAHEMRRSTRNALGALQAMTPRLAR